MLRGLCKLPDGRDWHWETLSFALVGRALLSKTLIQLSADWWGCSVQFSSVTQSCLTLCDPMDCSRLPSPSPTPRACSNSCPYSQWCHPTISSSVFPFSSPLQSFPASGTFPMSQFFASSGQSIGASASAPVLPLNIQDWFPLGWTGLISLQPNGLSRTPQFKSINSLALSFLYSPPLTSVHDYWKNHRFDYMDHCQQSNVSAF